MINNMPLCRTAPEEQGVPSSLVRQLVQNLDNIGNELHGIMIARNDAVIAESWLAPYAAHIPHSCHSFGKTYTCTAVGLACTDGLMTPDSLLVDIFADEIRTMGLRVHPDMKKVRIRDLMTMSSGTDGMPRFDELWLRNFLESPMAYEPGTHFYYNTTGSCVLGAAVEKVTGRSVYDYLNERIFRHIGIGRNDLIWQKFSNGMDAEPGICATTEANLRFGLFYLHNGFADDCQLIDKDWMQMAVSKQIETSKTPGVDEGSMGYGWQIWMGRVPGLYRFDGGQGQICFVYPRKNCVIAIHQAGRDPFGVERSIELCHAFMRDLPDEPCESNPQAGKQLTQMLQGRRLKAAATMNVCDLLPDWCGHYQVTSGVLQPWIEVYPVDADFWHYFYDPAVNPLVQTMQLRINEPYVDIIFNGRSRIRARMDGVRDVQQTQNVLPGLESTTASAWMKDSQTLVVDLRWLNGWFRAVMEMTFDTAGHIRMHIEKDMLHDRLKPIVYECELLKCGL